MLKVDYEFLNRQLTQGIQDSEYRDAIHIFLDCCEKSGKTADEAFNMWVEMHP